jgi:hypothetical protein
MIEKSPSKSFNLAHLIGIVWSVHILVAALLFPRPFLPTDNEIKKQNIYRLTSLIFGTLILFVNILAFVAMFTRSSWVDAAKVFFVFLTWLSVGVVYILFNHLRDVYQLFAVLEDEAIQSRDQSVMLIRAGQAALKSGNSRLFAEADVQLSFSALVRKIGPLALLFLQKEKDVFNIALQAGKVFFMGSRLFKNLF